MDTKRSILFWLCAFPSPPVDGGRGKGIATATAVPSSGGRILNRATCLPRCRFRFSGAICGHPPQRQPIITEYCHSNDTVWAGNGSQLRNGRPFDSDQRPLNSSSGKWLVGVWFDLGLVGFLCGFFFFVFKYKFSFWLGVFFLAPFVPPVWLISIYFFLILASLFLSFSLWLFNEEFESAGRVLGNISYHALVQHLKIFNSIGHIWMKTKWGEAGGGNERVNCQETPLFPPDRHCRSRSETLDFTWIIDHFRLKLTRSLLASFPYHALVKHLRKWHQISGNGWEQVREFPVARPIPKPVLSHKKTADFQWTTLDFGFKLVCYLLDDIPHDALVKHGRKKP